MTQVTIPLLADRDTRFAPGAFAGNVGKTIPVNVEGKDAPLEGTILRVDDVADGSRVDMLIDVRGLTFSESAKLTQTYDFVSLEPAATTDSPGPGGREPTERAE